MKKLQLTIYLKETDRSGDHALHELIVRRLLHSNIAGATVYRGVMGFGRHRHVHRTRLFGVSDDSPIVIVAVDDHDRVLAFLPELKTLLPSGLITVQEVETL
ncbi:MAG: DUF190 domain-containing protein [Acidobacteria bacterium]|nr:DUF190 domain-containing protein [Acidobacteriota bacterium]